MNLSTYLYILPFQDGEHFKLGISKFDLNRVNKHDETYGIDYDKALIVTADKCRTITLLERELLNTFDEKVDSITFNGKDGYTEIREISVFDEVLNEIKVKNKRLRLEVHKVANIKDTITRGNIKVGKGSVVTKDDLYKNIEYITNNIDYFLNKYKGDMSIKRYPKGYSVVINYGYDLDDYASNRRDLKCVIDDKLYGIGHFKLQRSKASYVTFQIYFDHYKNSEIECFKRLYNTIQGHLKGKVEATGKVYQMKGFIYPDYDKELIKYGGEYDRLHEIVKEIHKQKDNEVIRLMEEEGLPIDLYDTNRYQYTERHRKIRDIVDSRFEEQSSKAEKELADYNDNFYWDILNDGE